MKISEKDYVNTETPKLLEETRKLLLVNNYMWAVWSLKILKESNEGSTNVFNFDFADARIHMFNHVKSFYTV